jgi:hypothetical protein
VLLEVISDLEINRPCKAWNYIASPISGDAHLHAWQPERAVIEPRKILDNPGVEDASVLYLLAQLILKKLLKNTVPSKRPKRRKRGF